MKILVHPDSVPMSLEECIDNLKTYLDETDSKEIGQFKNNPFSKEKIGAAIFLKAVWSLNDPKNRLVHWFKTELGLTHPDDISGMILYCLFCDVKGVGRKEKTQATKYIKYRKKQTTKRVIKKQNEP